MIGTISFHPNVSWFASHSRQSTIDIDIQTHHQGTFIQHLAGQEPHNALYIGNSDPSLGAKIATDSIIGKIVNFDSIIRIHGQFLKWIGHKLVDLGSVSGSLFQCFPFAVIIPIHSGGVVPSVVAFHIVFVSKKYPSKLPRVFVVLDIEDHLAGIGEIEKGRAVAAIQR